MIIISSPSGGGKNTVINKIIEKNTRVVHSISTTTRLPRENEKEGNPYYFVDQESFKKMIANNDFLEWAQVYENYYGTTFAEIQRITEAGQIPILDIDIQGAMQIKNKHPEVTTVFIDPPSMEILAERLRKRGTDSEEQILTRLAHAEMEVMHKDKYDCVILNDTLEKAVAKLAEIIEKL